MHERIVLRRRLVVALGVAALAAPIAVLAGAQNKVWRIGLLEFGSHKSMADSGRYAELVAGLRDQGYVESRNFVFVARFADGKVDRLDGFAQDLVRQKVDLILSTGTPASHAANRATNTIPIVITTVIDPVGDGFATSLARPGGNVTGLSSGAEDTVQKLVELSLVAVPGLKRFAVLTNPGNTSHAKLLVQVQAAAQKTGTQALPVSIRAPDEIGGAFSTMAREPVDAVIVLLDSLFYQERSQIARLALKHRLPSVFPTELYMGSEGLLSYGANTLDNFRRAGVFVDKILKGAKPGEIPFEQPTRYYLVINRRTAKALGLKLGDKLLARADKVIE